MAKQEEIREGLIDLELGTESEGVINYAITGEDATTILTYLHSKGVVIKVDRELPNIQFLKGSGAFVDAVKRAGYVAVEPLIEEVQE